MAIRRRESLFPSSWSSILYRSITTLIVSNQNHSCQWPNQSQVHSPAAQEINCTLAATTPSFNVHLLFIRPFVRPSDCPSLHPSVCPSARPSASIYPRQMARYIYIVPDILGLIAHEMPLTTASLRPSAGRRQRCARCTGCGRRGAADRLPPSGPSPRRGAGGRAPKRSSP